jgi:hypothetical protein
MHMPHRLLAAVALLAACDSPADPEPRETSFTFEYRIGAADWRSFSARGQQPPGTSFGSPGPWVHTASGGAHVVLRPWQQDADAWASLHVIVTPQVGDTIFIGDPNVAPCPDGRPCTAAAFSVRSSGGSVLESCTMLAGAIVLTQVSDAWISGGIFGSGRCSGGAEGAFELRNGRFDIALPAPASPAG